MQNLHLILSLTHCHLHHPAPCFTQHPRKAQSAMHPSTMLSLTMHHLHLVLLLSLTASCIILHLASCSTCARPRVPRTPAQCSHSPYTTCTLFCSSCSLLHASCSLICAAHAQGPECPAPQRLIVQQFALGGGACTLSSCTSACCTHWFFMCSARTRPRVPRTPAPDRAAVRARRWCTVEHATSSTLTFGCPPSAAPAAWQESVCACQHPLVSRGVM